MLVFEKENGRTEGILESDDGEKKVRLSFRVMYSKMIGMIEEILSQSGITRVIQMRYSLSQLS